MASYLASSTGRATSLLTAVAEDEENFSIVSDISVESKEEKSFVPRATKQEKPANISTAPKPKPTVSTPTARKSPSRRSPGTGNLAKIYGTRRVSSYPQSPGSAGRTSPSTTRRFTPTTSPSSPTFSSPRMDDSECRAFASCIFKFADPANKRELTLSMLVNAIRMNYFISSPSTVAPLTARIVAKHHTIRRFLKNHERQEQQQDLFTFIRNEFGEFEESKIKNFSSIGNSQTTFGAAATTAAVDPKVVSLAQSKIKAALYGTDPATFFKQHDLDGGGSLDFDEFRKLVRGVLKISPRDLGDKEVKALMIAMDDDGSGELEIEEISDFVRRGVSTDPKDLGSLRRSLLLFESYGEAEVRRFTDMCETIDPATTMPTACGKTKLSENANLADFRRQVDAFFELADPSKTGAISPFMFEQCLVRFRCFVVEDYAHAAPHFVLCSHHLQARRGPSSPEPA